MKKRRNMLLLLSFIIIFILTACIENNEELELSEEVKKRLQEKREIPEFVLTKEVFKDGNGEVYGTVKYDYDDNGRLIQVDYINKDGEIIESKRYEYNEQGLRSKRIVTKAFPGRREEDWRYNTYDRRELRMTTEEVWYLFTAGFPIWVEGTTEYKYNKYGLLVSYEEVMENGEKLRWGGIEYYKDGNRKYKWVKRIDGAKQEFYYNKEGLMTKKVTDYGNRIKEERVYYDKNGNEIKHIYKDTKSNGEVLRHSVFINKYDNNNRKVETRVEWKDKPGYFYGYEYKYDDNDNVEEVIEKNEEGNIVGRTRYQYNEKGQEVLYVLGNGDINDLYKYETKYDKNGSKIKEIVKKPNGEIQRSWLYYYEKIKKGE